jgi:ATP-binding cassette subfamily B protein
LRRRVVVVEHSPVLFRGSLLDNLRYGHEGIGDDVVHRAAVAAGVDEFVRDLPDGYATQVGDRGAGLSTGQRQRIAIARASLDDPLIVVLDEAMSGLDRDTALAVSRAMDEAFAHRTRIVITHGDFATQDADLVVTLADGRLTTLAGA